MARQSRAERNAKRRANAAKKAALRPPSVFVCLGCGVTFPAGQPTQKRCKPCKRVEENQAVGAKRAVTKTVRSFVCVVCGQTATTNQHTTKSCSGCRKIHRSRRYNRRAKVRMKTDPQFAVAMLLRGRINNSLAHMHAEKTDSTMRLVGCSKAKLVAHLEKQFRPGMTWETRGRRGWHIDHILPCTAFDLTDPKQQRRCFHYKNLQPLWWYENIGKSNKVRGALF